MIHFKHPVLEGTFRERLHRFGARVAINGKDEYCSVTNSGRLKELLFPGNRVVLADHADALTSSGEKRKTRYSIHLAKFKGKWVSIEANLAPKLLEEAWREGRIPELRPYDFLKAEVPLDKHTRFDFRANNSRTGGIAWIEVKCCTLVGKDGIGLFPDAPSERASKHLRELMTLTKKKRMKCFVFFILQNPHGRGVAPTQSHHLNPPALWPALVDWVTLTSYRRLKACGL